MMAAENLIGVMEITVRRTVPFHRLERHNSLTLIDGLSFHEKF